MSFAAYIIALNQEAFLIVRRAAHVWLDGQDTEYLDALTAWRMRHPSPRMR